MEISSPPYPRSNASPVMLYKLLCELYQWTANHRDWANAEAERMGAPDNPFVPELGLLPLPEHSDHFLTLAVPDMFVSWQALRQIRERYDDIVRNYENEEDWESDASIYHRITVVRAAALLLSVAFLDSEKREAKGQQIKKESFTEFLKYLKHVFGNMAGGFGKVVVVQPDGEDSSSNEVDLDKLFNPEPEGEEEEE